MMAPPIVWLFIWSAKGCSSWIFSLWNINWLRECNFVMDQIINWSFSSFSYFIVSCWNSQFSWENVWSENNPSNIIIVGYLYDIQYHCSSINLSKTHENHRFHPWNPPNPIPSVTSSPLLPLILYNYPPIESHNIDTKTFDSLEQPTECN